MDENSNKQEKAENRQKLSTLQAKSTEASYGLKVEQKYPILK